MQRKQIPELLKKYLKNNYKPVEGFYASEIDFDDFSNDNLEEKETYKLQTDLDRMLKIDDSLDVAYFNEIENEPLDSFEPFEIFIKKRYRPYSSRSGGGKFAKRSPTKKAVIKKVAVKTAAKKSSGGGGGNFAKPVAKKPVAKKLYQKNLVEVVVVEVPILQKL